MVVLGAQVREQLGQLGLPPEAVSTQLGELSLGRLKRLRRLHSVDAQAALQSNRFAVGLRDGRAAIPKAFSNPPPAAAKATLGPFVESTYAVERSPRHPSADAPLRHLLHRRRKTPALMTIALARRPELRVRVGTAVGAAIADDGRTDGVVTIERSSTAGRGGRSGPASGSGVPGRSSPVAPPLAPPPPSYGTGSIWEIMMAMDQAILFEAARLGLGQGSGIGGTAGMMEAMGLWSLTPDDDDASAWMGFGQGRGGSTGGSRRGMGGSTPQPASPEAMSAASGSNSLTGTVGPESQNSGLDVQIMRVKRMIDKKTQMMELYSQSLSKYNSSANNIIGNMKG